jgi:pilus assembly protein CpaC
MLTGGTTFLLAQSTAQAVSAGEQILLRVRFVQVDNNTETILESNLASADSGDKAPNVRTLRADLDLVPFLEGLRSQEGGFRILAESNLLTSDAKAVTLLAGSRLALPQLIDGAISVNFQGLGIQLTFEPAITGSGNLHLSVKPEVKTLDTAHAETVGGLTIPALATRAVEANVELNDGQSFLISGLIDDASRAMLSKIPNLVERDPILRAIFKNGIGGSGKLVVIVTPELFAPQLADAARHAAAKDAAGF